MRLRDPNNTIPRRSLPGRRRKIERSIIREVVRPRSEVYRTDVTYAPEDRGDRRNVPAAQRDDVMLAAGIMYESGRSILYIASEMGRAPDTIRKWLIEVGVEIRAASPGRPRR